MFLPILHFCGKGSAVLNYSSGDCATSGNILVSRVCASYRRKQWVGSVTICAYFDFYPLGFLLTRLYECLACVVVSLHATAEVRRVTGPQRNHSMFIGKRGVEEVLKLNRILVIAVKEFTIENPPVLIATASIADSVPSGGGGVSSRDPTPRGL